MVVAMSGLPGDIFHPAGGPLYGLFGARPNWGPGANRKRAMINIPPGYYFNPAAFAQATVQSVQPIPSAYDPTALAGGLATDIGNVGRNVLRGPSQTTSILALASGFRSASRKSLNWTLTSLVRSIIRIAITLLVTSAPLISGKFYVSPAVRA